MAGCRASESACMATEAAAVAGAAVESMPRMKLSECFTGGLPCSDHVGGTSVKDKFREWTGVFHNHSAIYTKYKNGTKTTSTLLRRHVQHPRGSVTTSY